MDTLSISCGISLRWIPKDLTDDLSAMIQVVAWCCQAASHYLSQCWPSTMMVSTSRQQWVNSKFNSRNLLYWLWLLRCVFHSSHVTCFHCVLHCKHHLDFIPCRCHPTYFSSCVVPHIVFTPSSSYVCSTIPSPWYSSSLPLTSFCRITGHWVVFSTGN